MNKLIKTILLTLLLCIPTTYGMENNAIVSIHNPSLSIKNPILPNEIVQEIFRCACIDTHRTIKNEAAIVAKLRSLCKHWRNIFNPIASREILNWNPKNIASKIFATQIIEDNKSQYCYIQFLADAIQDIPALYDIILPIFLTGGQLLHAKILFKNGANPNIFDSDEMLLKLAKLNMKAFQLILQYGGDIYQDFGNGKTIMDSALAQAKNGENEMLDIILQEKTVIQPQYQQRIQNYLRAQNQTNLENLTYFIRATTMMLSQCTLF